MDGTFCSLWDHRNRLITIKDRNSSGGSVVKQVDYAYDAFNRLVKRTFDADGTGSGAATSQFWVYDEGINAVLQFDGAAASDLSHRYLWTGVVDELMADETVGIGADTLYALGDHLGTIRDIANFNESTSATTVTNHRTYNSSGRLVSETNTAVDLIFGYTGKQLDDATGLQHNLFRWYDAGLGQWLSEDPMGFPAGDENLRRYVKNGTIAVTDPTGLHEINWKGDWTPAQKKLIQDALLKLRVKIPLLQANIDKAFDSLSDAKKSELKYEFDRLNYVLKNVLSDLNSPTKTLDIYHRYYKNYPEAHAWANFNQPYWGNNWILLNDFLPWETDPDLIKTLFHELTHHYGTEDENENGMLNNAHNFEHIMDGLTGTGVWYNLLNPTYVAAQATEAVYGGGVCPF